MFSENSSKLWWDTLLRDEKKLVRWLVKLYYTEKGGYKDNLETISRYNVKGVARSILERTAEDELKHSQKLQEILSRDFDITVEEEIQIPSFYWNQMSKKIESFEDEMAVFHFGEALASSKFSLILSNDKTPLYVREFIDFALPDEKYHAESFKRLAGKEALLRMKNWHTQILENMTKNYTKEGNI